MSSYGQRFFRDPVYRVLGKSIITFHGFGIIVSIFIVVWASYIGLYIVFWRNYFYRHLKGWRRLEYWWTIVPIILLRILWFPSIRNLYRISWLMYPLFSFKAIGRQWYWSYEFDLHQGEIYEFQSYIIPDSHEAPYKGYRLLDVDWRIVAPAKTQITIYVRRTDVIHSFALPRAFIKADGIPGRINQVPLKINQCCILYGQCSEICGVNHSFIPIVIEFIPINIFLQWFKSMEKVY